ncbi:class I SAM-dependent methyltransferase [Phytoactinopolyspora limicola]|uniref:class I SAM-dependent methyltransferase n=1 Tax=Phytoactinopolyspora limicola TaxID=2715536 RepID=UPI001A9CB45F|nr:methyltransferase domain-containing protein [Phytoactinopolyspora limicola]
MDVDTLHTLAAPEGAALLAEASRWHGIEDEFALGSRLRRAHEPDLVAAALTQAGLRRRAAAKFDPDDATRMYFTTDGFEQATRAVVARHRATRIAAARPGGRVLDLCCGIGGDLVELARAGLTVTGVDADQLTTEVARLNIAVLGLEGRARVLTADATAADRSGMDVVTCDPGRRTARGRVFDPGAYQPPWSFVLELLSTETACVKVAPGIPHDIIPTGVEAEWVSDRGEVKEAALWSPTLASARRRATVLQPNGRLDGAALLDGRRRTDRTAASMDDDGAPFRPADASAGYADADEASQSTAVATMTDADDPGVADVRPGGRFIYEPDGAVIRAGLVTGVAASVDGWLLDPSIAYVSSDTYASTPFARGYRVVDVLPYDVKVLRGYVREHRLGTLAIKKRGVGVVPEQLRRQLRPRGRQSATLIVTRVAGAATVFVTAPMT